LDRAERSDAYRDARAEYERIRALREIGPIAAHLRERRFELGLTQEQVAKAAGTSHSAVSRMEKGTHIPQLPTLQRIAAALDEELLVCFQRTVDGEIEREFGPIIARWTRFPIGSASSDSTSSPNAGCESS
jgi:transcriptional regulator with XRE-family HTH domain